MKGRHIIKYNNIKIKINWVSNSDNEIKSKIYKSNNLNKLG